MKYIIILAVGAGLACIPASIASKKGYSYALFWCLSFFLSFLIVLIVAACLSDREESTPRYVKRCRNCGAAMYEEEAFCKRCGANQTAADDGSPAPAPADNPEQDVKSYSVRDLPVSGLGFISCPDCGEKQRADRNVCYNCGAKFTH